ncbi:MAG: hypothetical protein N2C14_28880, partial [Planctomycetales bacterium]
MSLIHRNVGHQNVISSITFSPDGSQILSGSWDGTAKQWDARTGELLRTYSWGSSQINHVAWSPDGATVAVAGDWIEVPLSESELKSCQAWFDHRDRSFFDSRTDDDDGPTAETRLFDAATGELQHRFKNSGDGVAFSPDGKRLAIVSWEQLSIIEWPEGRCLAQVKVDYEHTTLRTVLYSEDGEQVACVSDNGVFVFDSQTAEPRFAATDSQLFRDSEPIETGFPVRRLPESPERIPLYAQPERLAKFWRELLPGFRPLAASDGGMGLPILAFSPDGRRAAKGVRETGFDVPYKLGFDSGLTLL